MDAKEIKALTFEEALKKLEEIVAEIDSDEVDLERAIAAYETGMELRAHCEQKLNEAQEKITTIRTKDGGGEDAAASAGDPD